MRAEFAAAALIEPNPAPPRVLFSCVTSFQCGWLNALSASKRIWKCALSVTARFLAREKSQLFSPGALIKLRGVPPTVAAAGSAKAAGLNHSAGVLSKPLVGLTPETRLPRLRAAPKGKFSSPVRLVSG